MSSSPSIFRFVLASVAAFVVGMVALGLTVYGASFVPSLVQMPTSLSTPLLALVAVGSGVLVAIPILDYRRAPPVPAFQKVEEAFRIAATQPNGIHPGLIALVVVFVVKSLIERNVTPRFIALLLAALWGQELTHWVFARTLGVATDKVFTLRFLGRHLPARGPQGGSEAGTTLLALVPGIGIAVLLVMSGRTFVPGVERDVALSLLFVHGMQLVPVARLDGARIAMEALWIRHPRTELVFHIATGAVAFLVASLSAWRIAYVALVLVVRAARQTTSNAEAARRLRPQAEAFGGALKDAPAPYRNAFVAMAKEQFGAVPLASEDKLVRWFRDVHTRTTCAIANGPKAIAFLASYAFLAVLIATLLLLLGKALPFPKVLGDVPGHHGTPW